MKFLKSEYSGVYPILLTTNLDGLLTGDKSVLRMCSVLLTKHKLLSLHCSIILKVNAMIIVMNVPNFESE